MSQSDSRSPSGGSQSSERVPQMIDMRPTKFATGAEKTSQLKRKVKIPKLPAINATGKHDRYQINP